MEDKPLLLSLIKDDLINSKLVNGLNDLGLNANNYFIYAGETVFKLMGLRERENSEELFEEYLSLTEQARHIDISESNAELDELAEAIFLELMRKNE